MKRRQFIKLASTASAIGLMPFELKAMLKTAAIADCGDLSNRKLVLINLAGGNDGLNTLIPINGYDMYANLRPTLKIPNSGTNKFLNLDSTLPENQQLGLHPALSGFKSLYDNDQLRIIQSVGYPSQNKSHFASRDLYSTGNDGNSWDNGSDSGWIGRFLEKYYSGELEESYPLGVQIGSNKTELGFHGEEEHGLAINISGQDPSGFYTELNGLGGLPPTTIPSSDFGTELQYIINVNTLSNKYSQAISNAFNNGQNSSTYPDTDLSNQLKTVARLISGGLKSKVYMVRIGGFDTHDNQNQNDSDITGEHYTLLQTVSEAVSAFMNDLTSQTLANDVVGLTFSEFGRKAKENGNLGTDHGEIAPMFVFGNPVNGGVSGINVDLTEATSDNNYQIKTVQYDYRQTLGTLLQDFLGASNLVIDGTFFNNSNSQSFTDSKITELLKGSYSVAENCLLDTLSTSENLNTNDPNKWFVYPNPFTDILYLNSLDEHSKINYQLYDNRGQVIMQGSKQPYNNTFKINVPSLASGIYFLKVISSEKAEIHKVFRL
ncbi:conserved protein of unknown function precursor containing a T9SS type A C-terminal secretion signal [Tenacibaculum sp. 190524A02b]|uniref:Por secretion system C-terminal sorting domain-containing protein n=1 Tax=Tenacibaculum vairaonense TaxID=3137860 RepID=A0ABP1F821_9FLAO